MTVLRPALLAGAALTLPTAAIAAPGDAPAMVEIPAGSFLMGADASASRDWFNERPQHKVTISRPFKIAAHEVTIEDWRRFRPDTPITDDLAPYVAGISWDDAQAYAAWLSKQTGRNYRLPTEAEWEYAARLVAGGDARYAKLEGIASGPLEWTADRFAPYPAADQTDPTGAATGPLRVVRGGRIGFNPTRAKSDPAIEIDYLKPEARLAMPPSTAPFVAAPESGGAHSIGFRLVEGPAPRANMLAPTPPLNAVGIRQDVSTAKMGPDPAKPYFRRRAYLPTPFDDTGGKTTDQSGWDAFYRNHQHSPGIAVMPNGDVLIAIYTSYHEYEAGTQIIATRLRHGADQWDPPSPFIDMVGLNDHAPLLMRDGETVRFFWGSPYLGNQEWGPKGFPFQQITSTDNGATWSDIRFAEVRGRVGPHNRQPINSAFRDSKGRLLLSSDAGTQESITASSDNQAMLWASEDDGKTWRDTGGRSFGRHTTFVEAKDGRILGFGGKNTDIDGFMPLSTSTDGGKTYTRSKLPFPALGSGQRPMVLRLQSGRLLMIGDYVRAKPIVKPVPQRGSYVAVSNDDGATWTFKSLPGTRPHERADRGKAMEGGTVGYVAAAQGPDGVIHVVTSVTHPSVAFAFNEAWLDAPADAAPSETTMQANDVTAITARKSYEERYPGGALRGRWQGGRGSNGALVMDGAQSWYYPDGKLQWEVSYTLGRPSGTEKEYDPQGKLISQRDYQPDGRFVWTRWWPNGNRRSISHWNGQDAEGRAQTWSIDGKPLTDAVFKDAVLPGQGYPGAVPPEPWQ
ncbi:formylglycine-generating enzyme required for sulfatase activity [Sphingomonas zeicaulis]|uniref:SUMF1/EgtB/PvdO family nonheme iron enzyme n=1 Tax=Sphingomonas zeicaulis TaxID=1632740 RepID=UPI003D1CC442